MARQGSARAPTALTVRASIGGSDMAGTCTQELTPEQSKALLHPTPRSFAEYFINRQPVKFWARDSPRDPIQMFELTLSLKMTYDEVAQRVGEVLKIDPMKVRFYNHRTHPEGPFNEIKRQPTLLLDQMLVPASQFAPRTAAARGSSVYFGRRGRGAAALTPHRGREAQARARHGSGAPQLWMCCTTKSSIFPSSSCKTRSCGRFTG